MRGTDVTGSNEPLLVIRGVQQGAVADINPSDIKSIDVLKDASATAIYGSRGANAASGLGALQIQTPGVSIIPIEGVVERGRIRVIATQVVEGPPNDGVANIGGIQTPIGTPPAMAVEASDAAAGAIYGSRAAN